MGEVNMTPCFLITITDLNREKKLNDVFDRAGIHFRFHAHGQGTAPSAILDIFGFSGRTRLLTASILPRQSVPRVFRLLEERLFFSEKGRGIAFTIPITGLQNRIAGVLNDSLQDDSTNEGGIRTMGEHSAILVSVRSGFSDDVIDAARAAGARGGTILKCMRDSSEQIAKQFGVAIKEEQDLVLIVTDREKKKDLMAAIAEKCGTKTEAQGLLFSLPIDATLGLD